MSPGMLACCTCFGYLGVHGWHVVLGCFFSSIQIVPQGKYLCAETVPLPRINSVISSKVRIEDIHPRCRQSAEIFLVFYAEERGVCVRWGRENGHASSFLDITVHFFRDGDS